MSLNVPEFMPVLSSGGHNSPAEGACIMEYASFINGEAWSDRPSCTNTYLAQVARMTNDELNDTERQQLLPLLPRLMGTTDESANEAIVKAAVAYAETRFLDHEIAEVREAVRGAIYEFGRGDWIYALSDAFAAVAGGGGNLVKFLSHLIDAYDKSVGRTEGVTVTADDLRRCAELTGAKA